MVLSGVHIFYIRDSVYACPRKFLSGETSRNDRKVVVIPEWSYQVSIIFPLLVKGSAYNLPIIYNLTHCRKCVFLSSRTDVKRSLEIASICLAKFELTEDCINYQVIDFYQNRPNISLTKMFVAMTAFLVFCLFMPYLPTPSLRGAERRGFWLKLIIYKLSRNSLRS